MNFLGKSRGLLAIYSNMPEQSLNETTDMLLSPQFYTMKKETLPVKYAFQAKKIAPSLFDNLLDTTDGIEYFVYKDAEDWIFIAYNPDEIYASLLSKGIRPEHIGKIFFAQQILSFLTMPLMLGSSEALVAIDNSVTVIPQSALQENIRALTLNSSMTPKSGITLQGVSSSFLTTKQSYVLASIFFIFALMFFAEGIKNRGGSGKAKDELTKLLKVNPALESEYTRDSIATKYRTIDKIERKKRDNIKSLAGLIFKGVEVETFIMTHKKFSIRFKCESAKIAKHLVDLAKKSNFKSAKTLTWNIAYIEEML